MRAAAASPALVRRPDPTAERERGSGLSKSIRDLLRHGIGRRPKALAARTLNRLQTVNQRIGLAIVNEYDPFRIIFMTESSWPEITAIRRGGVSPPKVRETRTLQWTPGPR
jgi:hypothetical protein